MIAEGTRVSSSQHSMCASRPPSTTTPTLTLILALDDDCLMKIFSYLTDFDLCAVNGTSRRFEALSEQVFRAKYHSLDTHEGARGCFKIGNAERYAVRPETAYLTESYVEIINRFGNLIENIWLSPDFGGHTRTTMLFELLYRKCWNLKYLDLPGQIPRSAFDNDICSPRRFEHLIQLEYVDIPARDDDLQFLRHLITLCPKLKRLSIRYLKLCGASLLHLIGIHQRNIEELSIGAAKFTGNLQNEIAFSKLKTLKLHQFGCNPIGKLQEEFVLVQAPNYQLETLTFDCHICDAPMALAISKFINLKSLRLNHVGSMTITFFEILSKNLKHLEDLRFHSMFSNRDTNTRMIITAEDISPVLAIVEKSTALRSLVLLHEALSLKMDESLFAEFVNARKKSKAVIPLYIRCHDHHICVPLSTTERSKNFIQLTIDSK